jgi:hypothetical protein
VRRTLLVCGAVLTAACNSNVAQSAVGEFAAPTGIAATGARDRDLVFIANTGRDGLRAVQLCNGALLGDGGVDPNDTCPANENGQFITASIRVFATSVEAGERPVRLAGVRLKRSDGAAGVLLAAGVAQQVVDAGVTDGGVSTDGGATVAVVDARSLLDSQSTRIAPKPVQYLPVGARAVDVVAVNPLDPDLDLEIALDVPKDSGNTLPAFVATQTELLLLAVGLDGTESAALPPISGRCTLAPVVPTRIAVAPGDPSRVYVADGAGDGVVSVLASDITAVGGPCIMDRIKAGGRSVRSLAVSPPWYEEGSSGTITHPAGELLLMVLEPLPAVDVGKPLDPGGVVFAGTGTGLIPKGLLPNPAYPLVPGAPLATAPEAMQALSLPGKGLFQEGTFLRAVRPRPAPLIPDRTACAAAPCTPIFMNGLPSTNQTRLFNLVAAVTATDGATYFLDVPNRRFINQNLYSDVGESSIIPTVFTPTQPASGPVLELNPEGAGGEPGLVHALDSRAIWHSPIPGLDRRGGTVTPNGDGTLRFTVPPALANLDLWMAPKDPIIDLRRGDVVAFFGFQPVGEPSDSTPGCQAVFNETGNRFELSITALAADHLDLAEVPDTSATLGFHPNCPKFGAVVEVRTAADQPWLIFGGDTFKGRTSNGAVFTVRERRFDYPRSAYSADPSTPPFPSLGNDVAYTLRIKGTEPTAAGFLFTWSLNSGLQPTIYRDIGAGAVGYATAVYSYSSPRSANLLFTSVTGLNEVLQVDPTTNSTVSPTFYR